MVGLNNLEAATSVLITAGGFGILLGAFIGYFIRKKIAQIQIGTLEGKLETQIEKTKTEAKEILLTAKEEAVKVLDEAKKQEKEKEVQLSKLEQRLLNKEDLLEKKSSEHDLMVKDLQVKVEKVKTLREEAEHIKKDQIVTLEKISNLSEAQAKDEMFKKIEEEYKNDFLERVRKLEKEGQAELEQKAKALLAVVVQRYASSQASELSTSTVQITSEEVKGKIIGKEGRNIKALEKATGTEIIIDDSPDTILISCFDPIRRQVAKMALEKLIADGRIQPARIEELVDKAREEILNKIKDVGETAVYEAGIVGLDPKLVSLIGRLQYRTSYGQNILIHSLEAVYISAMLAEELGADVKICKLGALLHDIGKAVDHEIQGSHVDIGIRILEKFNVDKRVIQAMKSHHEDYPYETLEAIVVQTAEAISAARPGARRGTVEVYIKRLEELEAIAKSFDGVEKSYAISAGREVRIFVTPEKIDDLAARKLARDIAKKIEQELKYPGEIKVNVIRETRVIEYAH